MNENSYGNPYGNPYYPPQRPMQPRPAQPSMLWVTCEQEARSYMVAPNSGVALWDSNAPRVYLKQTDASGRPMFKAYDLVERVDAPVSPSVPSQNAGGNYVTREEFDALVAAVREIKGVKSDE